MVYAAARKLSALTLDPAIASLPAKPPSQDIQYQHARNLLLKGFHKVHNKPPWSREPQARYARQLSKSLSACNVSPITAAGVEFRIHSRMLVDGPKFREEWLIEGDMSQQQNHYAVALPKECHPILIDRLVSFLYTGDYDNPPANGLLYSDNGNRNLRNACHPTAPTAETLALVDALRHTFHLHMYALASTLRFPALKTTAQDKLWDILHGIMRPSMAMGARWILRECIDACSSAIGSDARLCADDDGGLLETIVAAVLAHEVRTWNKAQREGLRAYLMGPQYKAFWEAYHGVTAENAEVLAPVGDAGQARPGLKKAPQVKKGGKGDEAQRRRDRKEQFRRGLVLIEKQEAADLAVVMSANPIEAQDDVPGHHDDESGHVLQLPPSAMALTYRPKVGEPQQDNEGSDEGYCEGANSLARVGNVPGDVTEMRDRMMRMHIDDSPQDRA